MEMKRDSERVSPTGNIAPSGILNQLGRPKLDMTAVLVREAVQNSWDARRAENAPVLFQIHGWVLSAAQRQVLIEQVFADCLPEDTLPLAALLSSQQDIDVLTVSDRGTTGLGGPVRADVVTKPDDSRDFVDFLRDVGQPQQKQFAGGTYGYGKSIFYRASGVQTICVYTRCMMPSGPESRLMAAALGDAFIQDGVRYTGRHWWGQDHAGVVEPILNAEADAVASALGLPLFSGDELGTTIVILQPQLAQSSAQEEPQTVEQIYRQMAEYLLLYCWPKMLSSGDTEPPMRFAVSWQGTSIDIPDPARWPPLAGFVQAMRRLKAPQLQNSSLQNDVISIATQRPAKKLGELALQQVLLTPENTLEESAFGSSLFSDLFHHTALMRQPELIVTYIAGPTPTNQYIGYAGVFLADADVDAVFAASEPPTHDAWVREALDDRAHRTFVKRALEQIKDAMITFARPQQTTAPATALTPLGAFASMLGDSVVPIVRGSTARAAVWNESHRRDAPVGAKTDQSPHTGHSDTNAHGTNGESPTTEPGGTHQSGSTTTIGGFGTPPAGTSGGAPSTAPGGQRAGRASVRVLSDGTLIVFNNTPALEIPFTITHAPYTQETIVHAVVRAVLDGEQLETEPPLGGSRPTVLCWIAPDDSMHGGIGVRIPKHLDGTWRVLISLPADTMVSVELRVARKKER